MATQPQSYDHSTPSNIPIPDPTLITAQEIARAKVELREEFKTALQSLRDLTQNARESQLLTITTRLDGMDRIASMLPQSLEREALRLERLFEEKFNTIQLQFRELNIRLEQDRTAATTAVNAALAAQKEAAQAQNQSNSAAIAKSENSFTKEIDSLRTLITATKEGITADIINLTGRMDRGEGGFQGARTQIHEQRESMTVNTAIVGGIVGFLILVVAIAALWVSTSHPGGRGDPGAAIAVAPLNPSAIAPSR
jgi:cobalamin biosynthesis Mg chelatase CobN